MTAVQRFLSKPVALEAESLLYVAASALDMILTLVALAHYNTSDGREFYEANPIANYFLERWDMPGLVAFKFAVVAFVVVVVQLIAAFRVSTARRTYYFATILTASVALYSLGLLLLNW